MECAAHTIGAEGLFVLQLGSGDVRLRGVDGDVAQVEDRHGNAIGDDFDVETLRVLHRGE